MVLSFFFKDPSFGTSQKKSALRVNKYLVNWPSWMSNQQSWGHLSYFIRSTHRSGLKQGPSQEQWGNVLSAPFLRLLFRSLRKWLCSMDWFPCGQIFMRRNWWYSFFSLSQIAHLSVNVFGYQSWLMYEI